MKKYFVLFLLLFSLFLVGCTKKEETKKPEETSKTTKPTETEVQPAKYTVEYDLDGGECDNLVKEFEAGKPFELPTPTKEGYVFKGWFEGDTEVKKLSNKNYNLKATWEIIKLKVSIYNKETSERLGQVLVDYGTDLDLSFFDRYISQGLVLVSVDEGLENIKEDKDLHCTFKAIENALIFTIKEGSITCETYNLSFIGIVIQFDADSGEFSTRYSEASTKVEGGKAKFIYISNRNLDENTQLFTFNTDKGIDNVDVEAYYHVDGAEIEEINVDVYVIK